MGVVMFFMIAYLSIVPSPERKSSSSVSGWWQKCIESTTPWRPRISAKTLLVTENGTFFMETLILYLEMSITVTDVTHVKGV